MALDTSELSSLADMLEQLTNRFTSMAEESHRQKDDGVAKELFAVERALFGAHRRTIRLLNSRR